MKKLLLLSLLGSVLLTTMPGCKKPNEDVPINVSTDFIKYTGQVQVYDAAALARIPQSANVTVKVMGPDSAYVYDITGSRKFSINEGALSFALSPDRVPTEASPVKFNVLVKADGYLTLNIPVRIGAKQYQQTLQANMTKISAPPAGVSFQIASSPLVNNVPAADVIVTTPLTNGKLEAARITIPAGTEFYSVQGNQLSGTRVDITMGHFDTRQRPSLGSFPGGFTPDNVKMEDGSVKSVFFMSAGFSSINMSVGGQEVKRFSQPIQVTMSINPTIVNPTTNQAVKVGDQIPIWSYSAESGQWAFERNGTVVDNNGTLEVTFPMDHLTWVNYDWFWLTCWGNVNINAPNLEGIYDLFVVDQYTNGWDYYPSQTYFLYATHNTQFWTWAMQNQNVKFKVYKPNTNNYYWWWWYWGDRGTLVGESNWSNACGSTTINLNIPTPQVFTLDIQGVCPSRNNMTVKPSFYLWVKKNGSFYWEYLGFVWNGRLQTTRLEIGQTYEFGTWYGGQWISITQTVTKQNYNETVNLTAAVCNLF